MKFKKILIDYGHGGFIDNEYQTAGKRYTFTDHDNWTVYEGDINRRIAAKLMTMFGGLGIEVHDVVKGELVTEFPVNDGSSLEQKDTSLSKRVRYANKHKKNSLLVSIHANAIGNSSTGPSLNARGFIVFTSRGTTASDAVAESVVKAFDEEGVLRVRKDASDGDSDYERDFYMLHRTAMPAILTENGFFTNIDDAKILHDDAKVLRIARAHFKGILEHLDWR